MNTEQVITELQIVTRMIWESAVNADVQSIDIVPEDRLKCLTKGACVHILGGWNGSISIECEDKLAEEAARRMFRIDPDVVSNDDWHSVLKELANVTGGNIKSLLGIGCILSTPRAWEGKGFSFSVPECTEEIRKNFFTLGRYFVVRIHKSNFDLAAATRSHF